MPKSSNLVKLIDLIRQSIYLMLMSLPSIYLDAFYMCAQTSNFTKAAERLHITQSALSQRIKNLESELATSLFIRDRSGIRLTEAGYTLLRYCQSKESIESEAVAQIKGRDSKGLKGFLRIAGFSSVMRSVILPALVPILESNPDLKVSFITRELGELPDLLKRGEIDYMILDHELKREDLVAESLGFEQNMMVKKKVGSVPEIFIDHDESDEMTFKFLRQYKMSTKIDRRYFDEVYGLIDAVKRGLGKAILPLHLIKNEKELSVVNKEHVMSIPVMLHFYKQDYYSKLHQTVVDELKKNCHGYL